MPDGYFPAHGGIGLEIPIPRRLAHSSIAIVWQLLVGDGWGGLPNLTHREIGIEF